MFIPGLLAQRKEEVASGSVEVLAEFGNQVLQCRLGHWLTLAATHPLNMFSQVTVAALRNVLRT